MGFVHFDHNQRWRHWGGGVSLICGGVESSPEMDVGVSQCYFPLHPMFACSLLSHLKCRAGSGHLQIRPSCSCVLDLSWVDEAPSNTARVQKPCQS